MSDDPVNIQVNVRVKVPRGKKLGKRAIEEAVIRWAYSGKISKWVDVRAVHWLNPERRAAGLARWKVALARDVDSDEYGRIAIPGESVTGDTIEDARRSLRLPQLPDDAFIRILVITGVRKSTERAGKRKKDAEKRTRKVSKVRRSKRKGKKK